MKKLEETQIQELIEKAISSRRIYWLLWGMLAVTALCAWRFGLSGLLLL